MTSINTSIGTERLGVPSFNYQCRGTDILLPNNIHAYFVSTSNLAPPNMGIVIVHDIFGFKINNTRRYADLLAAKSNANVIMPDFFQGESWPIDDFPAKNSGAFSDWLKKISNWDYITLVCSFYCASILCSFIFRASIQSIHNLLFSRFFPLRMTTSRLYFLKSTGKGWVFSDFPTAVSR